MNPKNARLKSVEKKKLKPNWNPQKNKIRSILEAAEILSRSKKPVHKKASSKLLKKAKKLIN